EAPNTDLAWAPREQEVKARPEALVKGITPAQPAPVSTPAATPAPVPAEPAFGGLFKRLMGWLTGTAEPAAAPAPAPAARGGERSSRNGGHERARGERQGSERGRNRRGERRHDHQDGSTEENRRNLRGTGRRRDNEAGAAETPAPRTERSPAQAQATDPAS